MSLEAVQKYFADFNMADRVVVLEETTATVDQAASAHGVDPDQIAKTLSFKIDSKTILIVASGNARIDNKKYKAGFRTKARMASPEEVLEATGHRVGGVCPFGLPDPIDVYLDESLRKHTELIPAAGDTNAAIRLSLEELEQHSNFKQWVDVCK